MASIKKQPNGAWRARYRDASGKEHASHHARKVDAQKWLDTETAKLVTGTWTDPKTARTTVDEWCTTWLDGYATRRTSTVRQAEVHVAKIREAFGPRVLAAVRPSDVRSWTAKLKAEGLADSYVYALHARLSQVMGDAVHDGILARNPCSRRTSPGAGKQRPYVATTDQVWALYDTVPVHLQPAILLGAFAGLRTGEAVGLRVPDVDFMRAVVHPTVQYPAEELKTETSRTPVPIPQELALQLAAHVQEWGTGFVVTSGTGLQSSPWAIDRAVRAARKKLVVDGKHAETCTERDCTGCKPFLPEEFRFHDLRHYLASLLIASGADIKTVQARLRHASAKTTLDTYGHLWPDADESTRAAVGAVLAARADSLADSVRTGEGVTG